MKNKITLLVLMIFSSITYSQLNISTDYREDLKWNQESEEWEDVSSSDDMTFFEFEDTSQNKMGIFIHRTDDISSAYLIKSHQYLEEYDWDDFDIVSDVGNKYRLIVKMPNEDSDGFLFFEYKNKDGSYRGVKHRIKNVWLTEDDESNTNDSEVQSDLYDGTFSFKEYFIEREDLDPIEGIWRLDVVRELYYYDSLIYSESEQMRSEWAVAYHDETTYKVYGLSEKSDFEAFFEKTAIDDLYNYKCSFKNPTWDAKSNVKLELENTIIRYGYFVDDVYLQEIMGEDYVNGMKLYWDFTWIKKYPINKTSTNADKGCVSGDCEDGYGVYYFSGEWEGDVYRGEFKEGKRDGRGIYTFLTGTVLDGEWEGGSFIDNEKENNSDWNGTGTGFFIDRTGYLATNYHVIRGAKEIEIEFYRDGVLQKHNVEIVKQDKYNDLAILKISDSDFDRFDEIPYYFTTSLSDVGEEVFALGYPMALTLMGRDIKFTDGKISSKTGYEGDISNYQTTTPLQPGNSGGPLFDYNGNLIAVNASHLTPDVADNVSYSIKSSYLKSLIDVLPVKLRLPDNKDIKSLKLTEKIKVLSDYVVLIKIR